MSNQERTKPKYVWGIPLAGAILVLIGFLTPLAYYGDLGGSVYMWMWGLNIFEIGGYGTEIIWTENLDLLIPSIICSGGIFICILVLFYSVNLYKKSTIDGRPVGHGLLGASVGTIICTIGWMVSIEVVWSAPFSFWGFVDPHFGIFGLFIGSGISIAGYALSRYTLRSIVIVPKKVYPSSPAVEPLKYSFKYCPECGNKSLLDSQKFCTSCGFNFRGF